MFCIITCSLVTLFAILIAYLFKKCFHWSERGVPQNSPFMCVYNFFSFALSGTTHAEMMTNIYNEFPKASYSGFYQFTIPCLLLRDPELLKICGIKEFNIMMDHRPFLSEDADPIWGKNLFVLRGDRWRKMRSTLSPSFTGSKMKTMFNLMSECGEGFVDYFAKHPAATQYVNMEDAISRYAADMIATTAFGIKSDSMKDKESLFFKMGRSLTDFSSFRRRVVILAIFIIPKLAELLRLGLFSGKAVDFFRKIVTDSIRSREEQGIVRPDVLQILAEAKKGKKINEEKPVEHDAGFAAVQEHIKPVEAIEKGVITDEDIIAQAIVFFFAGFDNVSLVINFMAYELAINPEVQTKLQEEIDRVHADCNGKLTYEALAKMKYLDMVVTETLRKWPTIAATNRLCEKSITIDPVSPNEKPLHLQKDDMVIFPIHAIHHDEKYYPKPEKFDPERFNEENKSKITPYTYLPFGIGPRNCIGSRYALLEMKVLIYHLLVKFTLEVTKKTEMPLKLERGLFSTKPKNPIFLHLRVRIENKQDI